MMEIIFLLLEQLLVFKKGLWCIQLYSYSKVIYILEINPPFPSNTKALEFFLGSVRNPFF
jgi:hypothetical protein